MPVSGKTPLIMNLSKEKKTQLVFVGIGTLIVIGALWFFLIDAQRDKIGALVRESQKAQDDHGKMHKMITTSSELKKELGAATTNLTDIEATMPSGDLFSWIVSSLKQFNVPSYKVDMPQIGPPSVGDTRMFPAFPYSEAAVTVSGSAYYYDFGKFMADLENRFPYVRVQNIDLQPGLSSLPEDREKLFFRMQIVNLVKPHS
jgi:Tfp pilus assembly protein PilO